MVTLHRLDLGKRKINKYRMQKNKLKHKKSMAKSIFMCLKT